MSEQDMADIFQTAAGRSHTSAMSDAGEPTRAPRAGGVQPGIVRRDDHARALVGRGPIPVDTRKFRYDVLSGRAANATFAVKKDDRMSPEEAGDALDAIHCMFGVDKADHGFLKAFDDGLFFCHTLNSASVLVPGRSGFSVAGEQFEYSEVVKKLGIDLRRFFRAYADDVAEVNAKVMRDYDPYDAVKAEQYGQLQQVAVERGMQRYPNLCHDSADACVRIGMTERAAIAKSKALVLPSVVNSADRMAANPRVQSADKYDSTTGTVL